MIATNGDVLDGLDKELKAIINTGDIMRENIKLTYDSLIAMLQGKEFHLRTLDHHFVFHPPFDGVFLTHEQVAEIRHGGQMEVFRMLEKLAKYEETRESQPPETKEKDASAPRAGDKE